MLATGFLKVYNYILNMSAIAYHCTASRSGTMYWSLPPEGHVTELKSDEHLTYIAKGETLKQMTTHVDINTVVIREIIYLN